MQIDRLLARAARSLAESGSITPRLDAEVLLGHVLQRDRAWLYTWNDHVPGGDERAHFEALVDARAEGQPVAYLVGEREFWGLRLRTDPSTLIPRPDTECLVEAALAKATQATGHALDLGTGSGAIALAFASERSGWRVTAVDRQPAAVKLARGNAERLGIANIEFLESDWFSALEGRRFELILCNPPYLADNDPHLALGDVRFEPRSALVAGDQGLADLRYLIVTARQYLADKGWLMVEHGMQQGSPVRAFFTDAGYAGVVTLEDLEGRPRVSMACSVA